MGFQKIHDKFFKNVRDQENIEKQLAPYRNIVLQIKNLYKNLNFFAHIDIVFQIFN